MEGSKVEFVIQPLIDDLKLMHMEMVGNLDENLGRLKHNHSPARSQVSSA